jgi:hypothetical protein
LLDLLKQRFNMTSVVESFFVFPPWWTYRELVHFSNLLSYIIFLGVSKLAQGILLSGAYYGRSYPGFSLAHLL